MKRSEDDASILALNTNRNTWSKVKSIFLSLGPGIIIASLVFGPSKMTIASKLGSQYAYDLLWIIVVAMFFMAIFTIMGARIGVATKQSLLTTIKQKWGQSRCYRSRNWDLSGYRFLSGRKFGRCGNSTRRGNGHIYIGLDHFLQLVGY